VQEYFVYFKLLQRRAGGNLPVDAEAGLISVSLGKDPSLTRSHDRQN